MKTIYDIPITTMDGETTTLEPYRGNTLLIVNVASRCGFTPQYHELESLYREYQDKGLTILGFPCNQFHQQEPGDNASIKTHVESCFRITFPLFAKVNVKGPNQAPIYRYLKQHIEKKPWIFIPWNFTKILVTPDGRVLRRFLPTTSFRTLKRFIETI